MTIPISYVLLEYSSNLAINYKTHFLQKETNSTPSSHHTPHPYPSNFEELIMKLVNALVYITTQATQNKCHCSHSTSPDYSHGSHGNTGSPTMSHKPVYSHSDSGLVDIDILNSNKNDNVLGVDIGNTQLLGIGLGGRDSTTQHGAWPKGGQHDTSNSGGGINLDLLNANKKNNVADLNIGKENVLGVGLGRGGADTNSNYPMHKNNNENTTGEGLVNLSVLGANK